MFGTTDSRRRASCLLWLFVTFALLVSDRALAIVLPPSNLVLMPVQSFGGTVDSIPIPPALAGGASGIATGPITLSLDPLATNVFGLDNVLAQGYIDVTLILSSPLFTALEQTPRIRVIESGPASVHYVDDDYYHNYDFTFSALLTGGGTVDNGLFEGTVFHNLNAYEGTGIVGSWIVQPGSIFTWNIQHNGSITFPDGTTVDDVGGSGQGRIAPEPSSMALLSIGMATAIALLRRRKQARPG